ncbi:MULTISPECIES: EpsG family protein [Empedobacter]|uniref:EpsG family protein n=1 Tax=Empedobacter TaxID=59734 RepID=UPI00257846E8|nr:MULTISPECIES: EpsG family protein [Empedobacter]MDM1042800.1 EpsG family protein [Empedobacter brevis]MDM1136730.1 EpsG family protein [Empedobacter sp. R750]
MYFYYLTIIIFFCFALYETYEPKVLGKMPAKNILIIIISTIFIIQLGLRWETGSDWKPYLDHFDSQNILTPTKNPGFQFEAGYNLFVSSIKTIYNDYSFYLLIHAVIFFLLLKKGYEYFTPFSIISLLIFYVSFLGLWGANRQFLAIGIGMLALIFLDKGKWKIFISLVGLACLFHTTAFLLLVFLFLKKKFSSKFLFITIGVCIVVGATPLPFKLFGLLGGVNDIITHRTEAYMENAKESGAVAISVIGMIKRCLLFFIFYFFRDKIYKIFPKNNLIFNGYFVGICFYFIFYKSLPIMISRGSVYFNMLEPILIANLLILSKDRIKVFFIQVVILIYCFITVNQSIAAYPDAYDPYKGIFINKEYLRFNI